MTGAVRARHVIVVRDSRRRSRSSSPSCIAVDAHVVAKPDYALFVMAGGIALTAALHTTTHMCDRKVNW